MTRKHAVNQGADVTLCMRPVTDVEIATEAADVDCQRCLRQMALTQTVARNVARLGIKEYEATINVSDVELGKMDSVMGLLREYGHPTFDFDARSIRVVWEVGAPDGIPDLWDLRDILSDVEDNLVDYTNNHRIGKPTPVKEDATA